MFGQLIIMRGVATMEIHDRDAYHGGESVMDFDSTRYLVRLGSIRIYVIIMERGWDRWNGNIS